MTQESSDSSPRLVSLDVFRGLVILLMLLVNNIALDADTPQQLLHAEWGSGVHAADLVFPWFLLIVGVALPFSAAAWFGRGGTAWGWRLKGLQRAFNLFVLGCLIDCSIYKQFTIYMDVLQLIGLAWWVASFFYDLAPRPRALLVAGLLLWYWALMRFIPFPGDQIGSVTEDQSIITYIDLLFLEPIRLRGLVSVVPTAALVLMGTFIGDILRGPSGASEKIRRIGYLAVVWVICGMLMNLSIPYSKVLWTSSYILFCGGLGAVAFVFLYWAVDVRRKRTLVFPLTVLGMNAMAVYIGPILLKLHTLAEWTYKLRDGSKVMMQDAIMNAFYHHFGRYAGGWLYTWTYIGIVWLWAWYLYRKKIFWRV